MRSDIPGRAEVGAGGRGVDLTVGTFGAGVLPVQVVNQIKWLYD
jgi:hypothetical protein